MTPHLKPEEIHRQNRARECSYALDKFIGNHSSEVLRKEFERKSALFKVDYGADYKTFLKDERAR